MWVLIHTSFASLNKLAPRNVDNRICSLKITVLSALSLKYMMESLKKVLKDVITFERVNMPVALLIRLLTSHLKEDLNFNSFLFLCYSSYGQNLSTSTFIGETSFAILIAILGLVLFAHLIGNMQVNQRFRCYSFSPRMSLFSLDLVILSLDC